MKLTINVLLITVALFGAHPATAQVWQKLVNRADSLKEAGQLKAAYSVYQKAEEQAKIEFGNEHFNMAKTLGGGAAILIMEGNYAAAEQKLTATCNLLGRVAPTSTERVEYPYYLGQVYRNQAKYNKADSCLHKALELSNRLPVVLEKKKFYVYGLVNLASLYRVLGNNRQAKPLLIEALAIQDSLTGKLNSEYASCLNSLANVYDGLQEYTFAEPLYVEAIAINQQLFGEYHPRLATGLNNLGNHYLTLGDYANAKPLLIRSLTIRTKAGATGQGYSEAIQNLAFCYENQKQFDAADSLFTQSLKVLEKQVGKVHPSYANTLQNRANLLNRRKKYAEALQLHLEALSLARPISGKENDQYAQMLHNTALDYLALGELVKADSLIKMALIIANRVVGDDTILYATFLFAQGQIKCKDKLVQEGIALMEVSLKKYESIFNRNFLAMTAQQKAAFVGKWKGQYERYFSVIMASRVTSRAYDISLYQKAMLLNEFAKVSAALSQSSNSLVKKQIDLLLTIKNQIATQYTLPSSQRKNLDSLETKVETLEKEMARQSAPFRQAQKDIQVHWEDIRNALKPHEAAVEFVSFPFHNGREQTDTTRYMALVLRPNDKSPQLVPLLSDEAPLRQLLARRKGAALYAARGSEIDSDQLSKGDSLYRLIWQPIDRLLADTKTVYVSPAGLLHQVAFAALPYRTASDKAPRFLIDQYQIRQVSSTRQIATQTTDVSYQDIQSAQLYGGIQYDSTGVTNTGIWPFLPGTQQEVAAIGQLIGAKARTVSGPDATETSVKALSGQSPSIVHLATHGFSFPDPAVSPDDTAAGGVMFRRIANPLFRTGVLMAGANQAWQGRRVSVGQDDGILTAYEVSNLNLSQTKLVVLSACETALGDIRGSEGVFGLQRAFKMAGVRYLLMSLWPVSDQATSTLMTQFYRNWQTHKTIRKAFQRTQLQLRRQYPPAVWASFVLVE